MSDWAIVCDAIKDDLVANVPALAEVQTHLYAPWDPEQFQADDTRHLAIWPAGEQAETASPLATLSHQFEQVYTVAVWEGAGTEPSRLMLDEEAALDLLTLHNDIRDRFYITANQHLGDSDRVWYQGSQLATAIGGQVRWFAMNIGVRRFQAFA